MIGWQEEEIERQQTELQNVAEQYTNYHNWAQIEINELTRYKQALQRANGFLIMNNLEPVKLEYNHEGVAAEQSEGPTAGSDITSGGVRISAPCPTHEPPVRRNEACLGDGVPCASDGKGGCVACDDGKGNYRAAQPPAECAGCVEFVRMQHEIAVRLGVDLETDAHHLHERIVSALPPGDGESIAVWIDANDRFQWDFEINGDHPAGAAIAKAPRLNVRGPEPCAAPSTDLVDYGYAPGNYTSHCLSCDQYIDFVDKRCRCCRSCAQKKMDKAFAVATPTKGEG